MFVYFQFELGVNHFGEAIGNVKLPPWANSPEEFIRIHKEVCVLGNLFAIFGV